MKKIIKGIKKRWELFFWIGYLTPILFGLAVTLYTEKVTYGAIGLLISIVFFYITILRKMKPEEFL